MSAVVVYKDETGKLRGLGVKGQRAWTSFCNATRQMAVGDTLSFKWAKPRSPKFHRLYFAMLHDLFDRQENFADVDQLRDWLTVGAGYADFVPGPTGRIVAMPKSIAWERMDDNEFGELFKATWPFLRTEHATRFLWPHLDPLRCDAMVNEFLEPYQQ